MDIFDESFQLVEQDLKRDQFSRFPGECLRWDATYEFLSKTLNDSEIKEELKALGILFGVFGRIVFWGFAGSEVQGAVNYQRMHYYVRRRTEHFGGMEEVNKVIMGYSDVGCEGLKDPSTHWFTRMWPAAKGWPRHDLFHGERKVLDSTEGTSHELHAVFAKGLSEAALKYDKASVLEVAKHAVVKEKMKLSAEIAVPLVVEQSKYQKKMYNYTSPCEEHAAAVEELFKRYLPRMQKRMVADTRSISKRQFHR
jgi:hypothetical protein